MGIGAAKAERVDRGHARQLTLAWQWLDLRRHAQFEILERDVRVGGLVVQVRWHRRLVQDERGLDEAGDARAGLEVADVRLDRADDAFLAVGASLAEHLAERPCLDRISYWCSGAVCFHVADAARRHARLAIRLAQHVSLAVLAGDGHRRGIAVLVDDCGADQGIDPVAVRLCLGEGFDDQHPGALAAHVAVGAGIEGETLPARREHRSLAKSDRCVWHQQRVHAAGQRARTVAGPDRFAGQVDRDQRGRACGIDGDARSFEVEQVRDAVGRDRQRAATVGVDVDVRLPHHLDTAVLVAGDADEAAGIGAAQARRLDTTIFERLPRTLQQPALLGVHALRLTRRDPKKLRVELIDGIEKASPFGDHLDRHGRIRMVVAIDVPAVVGHRANGRFALLEKAPE